jgi:hypothetical protein
MTDDWRPAKYRKLEAALGEDLGWWLHAAREPEPSPSWQDIAYDLRSATGLKVTHETCRTWLGLWLKHGRQEQVT